MYGADKSYRPTKVESDYTMVEIAVTADDIANGQPDSSIACAFALALRRVFPEAGFVNDEWNPSYSYNSPWLATNPNINRFGSDFDAGKPVKPTKFHLRVPNSIMKYAVQ